MSLVALLHRPSHRALRHHLQPQVQRQARPFLKHHPLVLRDQLLFRHLPAPQCAGQTIIPDILTFLGPLTTSDAVLKSWVTTFTPYTLTRSRTALIIVIFFQVAPQLPTLTMRPLPKQTVTHTIFSKVTTAIPNPASSAPTPSPAPRTIPLRITHCARKATARPSRICSESLISSAATRTSKVQSSQHTRLVPFMRVWSTVTFTTRASASPSPAGPSKPTRLIATQNLPRERSWTKSGPRMLGVNEALSFSLFVFSVCNVFQPCGICFTLMYLF